MTTPTPTTAAPDPVRPLDLANLLHHALDAGAAGVKWADYESPEPAFTRVQEALRARAMQEATAKGGEPVAWQYRFRAVGKTIGEWSEWSDCGPDGKAPDLRTPTYETEVRPLYARPAPEVKDAEVAASDLAFMEHQDGNVARAIREGYEPGDTYGSPSGSPAPAASSSDELVGRTGQVFSPVPVGQTPLDDKLSHRLLDVLREGATARDSGAGSPYHGHSLEHCLHAAGWVSRDLRIALDARRADAAEMERKDARIAELEGDCRSYAKTMAAIEEADALDQKRIRDLEARATAAEAECDARKLTVFDWAFHSGGHLCYAGTPERAEKLAKEGISLTPVYTIDEPDARAALRPSAKGGREP